jgi:hypothetical protein
MNDDKLLDERIAGLVRSVERGIPPAVEENIRASASALRPRRRRFAARWARAWMFSRRRIGILALVPAAAAVLAAFLVFPLLKKRPAPRISEIRTEFEIADKNIKIIFFQRPDFNLSKEE